MYLKTLELCGFKSFPDKTVISFGPGMTAIVGANGSGKSNLSDAIRFVLGEMSAKALRGNRLEDVIFGGTATRKSANFAEVSMTIDNADHRLKYDGDEVCVTRRLYRDGTSEYKLNGASARLKDVVETFLDTGIGREGYSVIGQGRIGEILSAKGNDRRDVFEEAAGISKFRYRKSEAQTKLSAVAENAVRIGDILNEVSERLPGLEAQAKTAAEYRALSDARRELEIALFCEDLGEGESAAEKLQAELETNNGAYRDASDLCETLEREIEKAYLTSQEKNVEAEKLQNAIVAAATDQSELYSTLSVWENDIRHHEERIREAQESLEAFRADSAEGAEAREAARAEAAEALEFSRRKNEEVNEVKRTLAEKEAALDALAAEEAALKEALDRLTAERHEKELYLKEKSAREEANRTYLDAAGEKRESILDAQNLQKLASAEAEKTLEEKRALAAAAEEKLAVTRGELDRLARTCSTIEKRIASLSEARAVAEEKRGALLRMTRQFEGYPESVRTVMQASRTGKLTGICGPVSELISAPEEYGAALEAALGAAAGHIVVKTGEDAKAAIRYLKENRAGRATFLPLDTVERRVDEMDDIRAAGFIASALTLARYDKPYLPVAEYLLGKCAVAEDLDAAAAIARERGYKLKTVTLDGQVIHAGGAFSGGQKSESARLLSRQKDIRELEAQIAQLTASGEQAKEELYQLNREEEAKRAENSALIARLEEANRAVFDSTGALALSREREEALARTLAEIGEDILRLSGGENAEAREAEALAALAGAVAQKTGEAEELSRKLQSEREEARALRRREEELSAAYGDAVAAASQAESRREKLFSEEGARQAAIVNLEEQVASLTAAITETKEKVASAAGQKDEMTAESGRMQERLVGIRAEINELEKRSADLRVRQKEAITTREGLLGQIQLMAAKLERMNAERGAYLARLAEEYDLSEAALKEMKIAPGTAKALGGRPALSKLRAKIRALGPVNEAAPEEYAELCERHAFLSAQYEDVTKSREGLENLIVSLEKTMREMFLSTFEKLRGVFREIFREFFGGGDADIILTDREDLLNCFIEITVQPPGKNVKNLSLLSGGEQAFVAIALYLALLRVNPTPFCIFDEIESALDEANVARFADYLHRQSKSTQFLLISHRRGTMERADVLYGITMQEKGVSDFIRLEESELLEQYAED